MAAFSHASDPPPVRSTWLKCGVSHSKGNFVNDKTHVGGGDVAVEEMGNKSKVLNWGCQMIKTFLQINLD